MLLLRNADANNPTYKIGVVQFPLVFTCATNPIASPHHPFLWLAWVDEQLEYQFRTTKGEHFMTSQQDTDFSNSHPSAGSDENSAEIVIVRPETETLTRQRLPYFVGISKSTVGSQGISMNVVVLPAGGSAEPHLHRDYETAIYLVKGRVETRYGRGLKQSVIAEAGDFLFIPPGVPHQPYNLSAVEPAYAIVARNDPNEQENVVLYNPTLDS